MANNLYNWSDLDVGNMDVDHSENFFSKHHSKHEANMLLDEIYMSGIEAFYDKDLPMQQQLQQEQQRKLSLEVHHRKIIVENAEKHAAALSNKLVKATDANWAKAPKKTTEEPAPNAYRFKDIYEQKKQDLLRKCIEQEREMREFRSRPMPNFQLVHQHQHQHQAAKQTVHRVTCPVTPNVLKTSRAMELKRQQKVEEALRQREQEELNLHKMRPKARPVPKSTNALLKGQGRQKSATSLQSQLEIKPFKLRTEQRAQQRKLFNALAENTLEQKRQQVEEQRQRREWAEYQKRRQLATFRARPNPFNEVSWSLPRRTRN
ncbi:putative uncharacterized protein DDB_G0271606 [Scaptodrosophila lebanonensis]|uniref:TPX2 C-terminal domain-containing protein n=1 Tax=Drosophila lebanonensis TaxID=7225 RepID=A0A6J2U3K5_DROLE|nr:putative uncharacterized protein DDB_G0271606 [Scaptodrosophila lebanonensis]